MQEYIISKQYRGKAAQKKPNTKRAHSNLRMCLSKVQKQKREISRVRSWDSGYPWARALKSTKYTTIYHQWLPVSTFTGSFITELLWRATPLMKKKGPRFHNLRPSKRAEMHCIRAWCWWLGREGTGNCAREEQCICGNNGEWQNSTTTGQTLHQSATSEGFPWVAMGRLALCGSRRWN